MKKIQLSKNMAFMLVVFTIAYMAFTVSYMLMVPYLTKLGYTGAQQGAIMSIGSLFGMVAQMIVGFLCDKFKSIKKPVYICMCLLAVSTWGFYQFNHHIFAIHLGIGTVMMAFFNVMQGLLDSWALETDDTCRDNYGSIRAFGAIGWIIGGTIIAWFVQRYAYECLGMLFALYAIVMFAISYFAPEAQKTSVEGEGGLKLSDTKQLFANKRYVILLVIFFFAFLCNQSCTFLAAQKITRLSADTAEVFTSMKSSVQAIFELPFFFMGGYLLKKHGPLKLLAFGLGAYMLRFVLEGIATTQMHIIYITPLQMVTFPLMTITAKVMIDEEIPSQLRSSGQQIAFSLYSAGSGLLGPTLFGYLMDAIGIDNAMYSSAAVAVVALGLVVLYSRMMKKG